MNLSDNSFDSHGFFTPAPVPDTAVLRPRGSEQEILIVDDLLSGQNEWRNIQDIVRLTFKALTDVVKDQQRSIRDMQKQLDGKITHMEVHTQLQSKAGHGETQRQLQGIVDLLEEKTDRKEVEELATRIQGTRREVGYMRREEVEQLVDVRVTPVGEMRVELNKVHNAFYDWQLQQKKSQVGQVTKDEMDQVYQQLERKAETQDVQLLLEGKLDRPQLSHALARVVTEEALDRLLMAKADREELVKTQSQLEAKTDTQHFRRLEDLLECKSDKSEMDRLHDRICQMGSKREVEAVGLGVAQLRQQQQLWHSDYDGRVDRLGEQLNLLGLQLREDVRDKASVRDLLQLQEQLGRKGDGQTMRGWVKESKADTLSQLQGVKDSVSGLQSHWDTFMSQYHQSQTQEQESARQDVQLRLDEVQRQVSRLEEEKDRYVQEVERGLKEQRGRLKQELQKSSNTLDQNLTSLAKRVQDLDYGKLDKRVFLERVKEIAAQLENKTDLVEVQSQLTESVMGVTQSLVRLKDEVKNKQREALQDIRDEVSQRALISEVNKQLALYMTSDRVEQSIRHSLGSLDTQHIKRLIDGIQGLSDDRVTKAVFTQQIESIGSHLQTLEQAQKAKLEMAQLCPVLDNKANIDDINRVFQELHQELLLKASLSDLKQLRQKQTLVNESLCQENITGRWLWKSGSLRSGHSVAWDSQVINTLPDNFAFTKGGSQITVHTQGLYMVCFGFYSTKKPTIQLLLNGEPLLSAVNSNSYVVHHSAGKLKDLQHSTGNVTGLTMTDFLQLPPRSKISFTYAGDKAVEGFFSIRRM